MKFSFILLSFILSSLFLHAQHAYAGINECLEAYRFEQDAKVMEVCKPLAEQGNRDAETVMGMTYYSSGKYKDDKQAFQWLEKAAAKGQSTAQRQLGVMYYLGESVAQDRIKAEEWIRKAAERGEPQAQYQLSLLYRLGEGDLAKDDSMAFEWAKESAKQGNSGGQLILCQLYGKGVEKISQDYHQAFEWCKKSAEQGNPLGQLFLASLYGGNNLGKRDFKSACKWLFIAQDNIGKEGPTIIAGDSDEHTKEKIKHLFTALNKVLTPEEIAEAKRQAEEWQTKFDARKKKEGRQVISH